jgi:hypothetical protein
MAEEVVEKLDEETRSSLKDQFHIEQTDTIDFAQYLENYYSQYGSL